MVGRAETYFLAGMDFAAEDREHEKQNIGSLFSGLAPFMMFVRQAAGDSGWHTAGQYANLTIDDPWLTEPYGFLNYKSLLAEMEKHNFHTTVAFIPWNFDRSEGALVSLIRAHPNRFSIAIHGNNHDHREFDQYSVAPIGVQERDIKQALSRMERFTLLTGIPYDPVMVFPHGIAPAETLDVLKRSNFLATVNSQDIPLGSPIPAEPSLALRSFTTRYGQFPSLMRYSAEVPVSELMLATNAFLGNPILLYGHHGLFQGGSSAFNKTADTVNRVDPGVQWCSLGCIAAHLYLLKLNSNGQIDTMMLASRIQLENRYQHEAQFVVHKKERDPAEVESVTVDGKAYPFVTADGTLTLTVSVPARGFCHISILYRNYSALSPDDYSKHDIRVMLIRRASDFRDLTLSKWTSGAFLTRLYYTNRLDDVEAYLDRRWPLFVLAVLCLLAMETIRRKKRSRLDMVNLSHSPDPPKR